MTGTTHKFIDTPWVCTHASNPGAEISNAMVSAGKGPQETLDRKLEIWTWEGAGADGDQCGARRLLRRRMMTIQTRGRMRGIGVGMGAREAHRGYAN